jgi:type I restriction enzyme M protein
MANDDFLLRLKREIQRGVAKNIVKIDDEEKNILYIAQNKKFRLSDPEELVRAIAYVSLILDYGNSARRCEKHCQN